MTTKEDIRRWLMAAKKNKSTHLLVCTDGFDYSDYPVEVKAGEDVRKIYDEHNGKNMQKVMEVYNLAMDIESQLAHDIVCNFDTPDWIKEPFLNNNQQ